MLDSKMSDYIKEASEFYSTIEMVFCPILNETVYFNAAGFHHLIWKNKRRLRSFNDCVNRLVYLRYVTEVIANSRAIYETRTDDNQICRYALAHKVDDGVVIRVVLQRVGSGNLTFLSVMLH
jgi:hypothetical protein